jgi:hypothetical protein
MRKFFHRQDLPKNHFHGRIATASEPNRLRLETETHTIHAHLSIEFEKVFSMYATLIFKRVLQRIWRCSLAVQLCANSVSSFTLYKSKSLSHSYLRVHAITKHKPEMADMASKIRNESQDLGIDK